MVKQLFRMCPAIVEIRMKSLIKALEKRNQQTINRLCTVFVTELETIDLALFSRQEAEHVCHEINQLHLFTFLDLYPIAVEKALNIIKFCKGLHDTRVGVINSLVVEWYEPKENDEFSLGAQLDNLPKLVKFEIGKCLEKVYNMP